MESSKGNRDNHPGLVSKIKSIDGKRIPVRSILKNPNPNKEKEGSGGKKQVNFQEKSANYKDVSGKLNKIPTILMKDTTDALTDMPPPPLPYEDEVASAYLKDSSQFIEPVVDVEKSNINSKPAGGDNSNIVEPSMKQTSYADKLKSSNKGSEKEQKKANFRFIKSESNKDGIDVVIPVEIVKKVTNRFENSLYGYFLGERLAFPVVENYVKNAWTKFGLKRLMMNDAGFFFFQFNSKAGMDQVLERGPWMIRSNPILLNIWTPDSCLSKKDTSLVPVWVDLYDVPLVAFTEDGLSLIASKIGKPMMLDSYTNQMCNSSWGRHSFARALIEIDAKDKMRDELTIAIPNNSGDGFSKQIIKIDYEWRPPQCMHCCVFGHEDNKCPMQPKAKEIVTGKGIVDSEGFTDVVRKKFWGKKQHVSKKTDGFHVNKTKKIYRPVEAPDVPKKGNNSKKPDPPITSRPLNTLVRNPVPLDNSASTSNPYKVLSELNDDEAQQNNYVTDSDEEEVIFDEASNALVDSIISEGASTPDNDIING